MSEKDNDKKKRFFKGVYGAVVAIIFFVALNLIFSPDSRWSYYLVVIVLLIFAIRSVKIFFLEDKLE